MCNLKESVQADLPARARVIPDQAERRDIFSKLFQMSESDGDLEALVEGRPLVEVTIVADYVGTFMQVAIAEASATLAEGGYPFGAVLVRGEKSSYVRDPFGHTFEVEEVASWPLPPVGDPTRWSFPKRPTDALRWDRG